MVSLPSSWLFNYAKTYLLNISYLSDTLDRLGCLEVDSELESWEFSSKACLGPALGKQRGRRQDEAEGQLGGNAVTMPQVGPMGRYEAW